MTRSPAFSSLAGYRPSWLRGDLLAGLTVWAVLIPESLAYASIAGNSGRFAALTATLAITIGILGVAAGLARLGFVANFISEPVLKGFIIGQVPKLLGIEKRAGGDFFAQAWTVITRLGHTQWRTLVLGLGCLAIVVGARRVAPAVPGSLIAVAVGILAVYVFHLQDHGVKIVGHVTGGLSSVRLPSVPSADYLSLAGPAVGILLVGFAEGLGAAKTYTSRGDPPIQVNRELAGLGASNLAAGLCGGMVVNGSLSKTAVNASGGARSQLSGLIVAAATIVTLLFLTGLFQDLPEATLGAVVIAALIELVDIASLRRLYRASSSRLGRIYGPAARADFIAAVAAMLGVLVFDTLPGLFIGIAVSLLLLLYRATRPHVAVLGQIQGSDQWADIAQHPENRLLPGVTVLRVESGIFFANAEHVRAEIERAADHGVRAVVLDLQTVPFVDVTAAGMLSQLTSELGERGVRLVFARDVGQVRDMLARAPSVAVPEQFRSLNDAIGSVGGTG